VKAPAFAYARAESLEEALTLLGEAGEDAKLLAGGQSLVPLLAYRLVRPSHLVDVDRVSGLDGIAADGGTLELGALVRHSQLERAELPGAARVLREAAAQIGHLPIRTRGTLGGSLAHADPSAELPVAVLALDGRIVVASTRGEREVEAEGFFVGPFTTAVAPDEAIAGVRFAAPPGRSAGAFAELAVRAGDFALASAAAAVAVDDAKRVAWSRIALGGVDSTPVRAPDAEAALLGSELDDEAIRAAAATAAAGCRPLDDRLADASYRRELVAVLVRDALLDVRRKLDS
jgi:carbon-monoxide dehydrogenase medium subunit/6-hydroxypseudooxynicotine dehydrogenase subunit alpha